MPDDPRDPQLDSFARRLLAIGQPPLAVSHEPPAVTPPQQAAQPRLAVSHVQQTRDPLIAATLGARGIGPSQVGERYVTPTVNEMMGMENPAPDVAARLLTLGLGDSNRRPPSVAAADPIGIGAWEKGAGPMPMFMGSTEPIEGPGLYSRVDRVAETIPERGVHPNKLASLLKSGASQEEVAYRKLPEFLAAKGDQPVTRAELQAHLAENPAPFPKTVTLGGGATGGGTYTVEHTGSDAQGRALDVRVLYPDGRVSWSNQGHPVPPEELQRLIAEWHGKPAATAQLARPTKYSSYSLPGGEQYREHLITLPDPVAARRAELQQQMEGKLTELKNMGPLDPALLTPEAYHASPQYARLKEIMDAHNALNEELRALPASPAGYQSGHFDEPNILTHVRTTERTLPGEAGPPPPPFIEPEPGALAREGWTVRVDREDPYSGTRQMTLLDPQGEWSGSRGMTRLTPEQYLHETAVERAKQAHAEATTTAAAPSGPRGRFIEEIQSDWHQAGKRQGYATRPADWQQQLQTVRASHADQQATFNAAYTIRQAANERLGTTLIEATRPLLPPEYRHLQTFSQALAEGPGATEAWRAARDQAYQLPQVREALQAERQADQVVTTAGERLNTLRDQMEALHGPKGVPDAPFKQSWPDLALKQQLLDVARDPHADWLGFTSGKTQAERYDLSKQVSRLTFEPEEAGDYSLGSLVAHDLHGNEVLRENRLEPHELDAHIGKEPADALRREIASHAHDAEQWTVGHNEADPSDKSWYVIDPNGEIVDPNGSGGWNAREMAERERQRYVNEQSEQSWPHIAGLDLSVGGEGMRHFYDQLLPSRLQKLLKPFGGTVERGQVSALPHGAIPQRNPLLEEATAWIAHLTPEMKRAILKKGFPLMLLPLAVRQAIEASRSQVGEPPPVTAPPLAASHPRE